MSVFPVVLDASPSYLGTASSTSRSLVLTPVGNGALVCQIHRHLSGLGANPLTVIAPFEPDDEYRAALKDSCGEIGHVLLAADASQFVASLEPSDWLLFLNSTCIPVEAIDSPLLLRISTESPRTAVHLIGLERHSGGTCECVDLDERGEVARIRRYYDEVTWSHTLGIVASMVPASCLMTTPNLAVDSLAGLRMGLAAIGFPARDLPLAGGVFDLSEERQFLMFSERIAQELDAQHRDRQTGTTRVHESARLLGPVIVQSGARIEANAVVIGPTVIGAGATVGANALVVQSVVRNGTSIAAGSEVRHRVVSADRLPNLAVASPHRYDPLNVGPALTPARSKAASRHAYPRVKLVLEIAIAATALLALLPLLLLIAIAIALESPGPVLFMDRREARGGRNFYCLKFRTMRTGAEQMQRDLMTRNEVDGPQFKLDKDPRVTRVGRWIRPCSLDELPQLINVLLGDMSLVGPRPSPFRENQTCVPWREGRLSVRPGITGLWQVCRHDRGAGDFHQWIYYDLLYVEHMSFAVDLKIILATILGLGGQWCIPLTWIIPASRRRPGLRTYQAA